MSVNGTSSFKTNSGNSCKKEESKNGSNKKVRYKRGERICQITLHYCTALGLIYHKILGVPPELENNKSVGSSEKDTQKQKAKRSKAKIEVTLVASPHVKKVRHEPLEIVQSNQKSNDLVDLTADDNDDRSELRLRIQGLTGEAVYTTTD
jgi:hypothetical protein